MEKTLSVSEARKLKSELEHNICDLLIRFEETTGLKVDSLDLKRIDLSEPMAMQKLLMNVNASVTL